MKRLYDKGVKGMYEKLLGESKKDKYLFVGEKKGDRVIKKMDERTCFVSGMLALGAANEVEERKKNRDLEKARGLAFGS